MKALPDPQLPIKKIKWIKEIVCWNMDINDNVISFCISESGDNNGH